MPEITKARIDLREGIIELEGSEDFVQKNLDKYDYLIVNRSVESDHSHKSLPDTKKPNIKKAQKSSRKPVSLVPIPVDLEGDEKKPALRDFYAEKLPNTNEEKITVFIYYLEKHLGISDVEQGHIISCYKQVNERIPKNIYQLLKNIKHNKGWISWGEKPSTARINIQGENLIEHDLPRTK